MPRKARVVIPGIAHHVVQRGNYQQYVFESDADFRTYLYLMKEKTSELRVRIHSYCLMNNHVHFIVTPSDPNGLSELFKFVHMRYSQYKNIQQKRLGHLWQARFYSCVLDPAHLLRAIRYVELNPVRARMVPEPWDYVWSSTRQHLRVEKSPILLTDFHQVGRESGWDDKSWMGYLLNEDKSMVDEMRSKTRKGLAVGEERFVERLEKIYAVSLRECKRGRPKIRDRGVCP